MNFMLIGLNNIEIPAERFDFLPSGAVPGIEIYLISPQCRFSYNGKDMTSMVEASPFQRDFGMYDWHAMVRKPLIAVWQEEEGKDFHSKEEADAYYTPREMIFSDIALLFGIATWFVKDSSVYSDSYYWRSTDSDYSVKGKRTFQQTMASGRMDTVSFEKKEIEDALDWMLVLLKIYFSIIEKRDFELYETLYSQGTIICNTESAIKNNGSSFYRILNLLQLAIKTGFLPEKISMYCAVLECLFAIEKNHKKTISEMTAAFVSDDPCVRATISQDMRQAYGVRSDFVHGDVNLLFGSNAELAKLSTRVDTYVRRALRRAFLDENCNYENSPEDKRRVREHLRRVLFSNN